VRSNADTVARRAEDEHSPVSPRLTEPALAIICGRSCAARLTMDNWRVRTQAYFQMPINRPLDHLDEIVFLWAIFRECFAIVGHTVPSLFVNTYY
jgi:hypothetical protein